jgi:AraC family transcriptional regulator, regulatory protein of adaptative response / methylated-DNA-[protein]-cysteine methyltransferase
MSAAANASRRDYERIARAMAYLWRHAHAQPDLADVARRVHLSEHHFQRLFTRWAGVSPKRFLQYLTVEQAKRRGREPRSVAALAGELGLSGPGRLHDLFVTLEALSPGEFRSGGEGLRITYGLCDSPFGPCFIAESARGICALRFLERATLGAAVRALRKEWPHARLAPDPARAEHLGRHLFEPLSRRPLQPVALLVKGTNFQLQVWRALLDVAPGAVTTYGRLAAQAGHPLAARAVGGAVGANPIAYLIPCHRVIRESGMLGGYRWGEDRKAAMLGWEAARIATRRE